MGGPKPQLQVMDTDAAGEEKAPDQYGRKLKDKNHTKERNSPDKFISHKAKTEKVQK